VDGRGERDAGRGAEAEVSGATGRRVVALVGERGYQLSGGERQRLTIARLLLARPRVVILDGATAQLDSTSELAVQEALAEALTGLTAVVIAHRLSTIRAADLILVIEDGQVAERGPTPSRWPSVAGTRT
jgi:ABC-type multidrug transport system fused ATPase/permease subunit